MDIESDVSHIVSSYHLDDFDYKEFSDNERAQAINDRWRIFRGVKKQPGLKDGIVETK